jgi:hypothetical protein
MCLVPDNSYYEEDLCTCPEQTNVTAQEETKKQDEYVDDVDIGIIGLLALAGD